MDPQAGMDTAKEMSKALTELLRIVQKFFNPHVTRKQADADAYADQKKLDTIRENQDMEVIYFNGKMNARERSPVELVERAKARMLQDAIRQEDNLEKIFDITADELKDSDKTTDTPVDDDWLARLFQIAKDVSSEEMQYIWGKILAGEINKPGSYSIRTLEKIKDINTNEAEIFQKILPLVMIHGPTKVITSDTDLLKKYDLAYSDILLLNECGLINVNSSNMHFDISTDNSSILFTNEKLILVKGSCIEQKRVIFGVYSLTQAGKELHSILIQKSDSNYIFDFGLLITQKNAAQSPIVSIHEVIEVKNDNVEYIEEPLNIF